MFEKDGIVYENEGEYLSTQESKPVKKKSNPILKTFFILIVIAIVIPMAALMVGIKKMRTYYNTFDSERIAEMEQIFDMSFEGASLDEYLREVAAGDAFYQLWLSDIEDYNTFLENNLDCEYRSGGKGLNVTCDYRTGEKKQCSEMFHFYPHTTVEKYKMSNFTIYFFPQENGGYSAFIYGVIQ